jgi:hypothetical protein
MTDFDLRPLAAAGRHSRRAALTSGALAAALATIGAHPAAAEDATPAASEAGRGPLLVQAFSHGTLFPTQGDSPALPPLTLILWDAAERGVAMVDPGRGRVGVVPADRVLASLGDAGSPARAALVARLPDGDDAAGTAAPLWVLGLVQGELGSDPGAVTYLGDVLTTGGAEEAFGMASSAAPEGAQDLGSGFLLVAGLPENAWPGDDGIWLTWS